MDEQRPVITQEFTNCTIIVHISTDDFVSIIRDLVEEGIITPQIAKKLVGDEDDRGV